MTLLDMIGWVLLAASFFTHGLLGWLLLLGCVIAWSVDAAIEYWRGRHENRA